MIPKRSGDNGGDDSVGVGGVETGDFFKEILDILTLPSIATS